MKTSMIPVSLIALACSAALPVASAQDDVGFESSLALQMKVYATIPAAVVRDESGAILTPTEPTFFNEWFKEDANGNVIQVNTEYLSLIQCWRLSNKEFLQLLVEQGVIDDITGWSLKVVEAADDGSPQLYIVKSGEDPIWVGDFITLDEVARAEKIRDVSQTKIKYDADGNETSSTFKEEGSSCIKLLWNISLQFPEADETLPLNLTLTGLAELKSKITRFSDGYLDVPQGGCVQVIGTADQSGVEIEDAAIDLNGEIGVVDGSWKISKARVLDNFSDAYPDLF